MLEWHNLALTALYHCGNAFPGPGWVVMSEQVQGKPLGIADPDAAVTERSFIHFKQVMAGCIMEIYIVLIGKNKFDCPQCVVGSGILAESVLRNVLSYVLPVNTGRIDFPGMTLPTFKKANMFFGKV